MPEDVTTTNQPSAARPELRVQGVGVDAGEAESAAVRRWTKRIRDAREGYKKDFDRMRANMEFAFGLQWPGQKSLADDRYAANLTIQAVNRKVALLYARDPKAVYRRRKRLEYQVWDEKLESLGSAVQRASAEAFHNMPPDPESLAIIQDYENGRKLKQLIDRVGRTLEIIWQHQVDSQEPDFKTQAKQLVRRVITCGVGYIGLQFERTEETLLDSTTAHTSVIERTKALKALVTAFAKENGDTQQADAEQIRLLAESIVASGTQGTSESEGLVERLVFDFIPATALIPDPACRCLKGFVGAHWLAHEMILPLDYVNAYFELDIETGSDGAKLYGDTEENGTQTQTEEGAPKPKRVCVWHIYDLDTKSHFFLVDGYKQYAQRPEAPDPSVHGFFPIVALTFNDVEVVEGQKASIFPPSDVELMKHPQKEWNRTRDGLRVHRKAKAPKWLTPKGVLSDDDLAAVEAGKPCQVIQMESITKQDDITKILMPFPHEPIDPAVYDTKPLSDDLMFAVGTQEANLGPAKANVTATVGNIAEQSRMTVATSNVDDLDDFLSALARMGGEMLLRNMSVQTARRIAGPGASWPATNRDDFLNHIFLEVVAASSGRPNRAMELQNARELGPLLIQAGANPMFLVRELVKRLDDRLDPEEAFPLVPQTPETTPAPPQAPQPATPSGGPAVNPA